MQRVTANGIDFAYLEDGPTDGPLALCLHGFPDVATTWDGLLPLLAEAGFHAVAPYMRGYAPTGLAPGGDYHAANLGLDALALTDAFVGPASPEHGPPVIIGHDWGALGTWVASSLRPERYSRVVAMSVPHPGTLAPALVDPEVIKACWYQHYFQLPVADMVVPADDFAFIDLIWKDWSPGRPPDPDHVRAVKDCLGAEGVTAAAIGYYRATIGGNWAPTNEEEAAAQAAFIGSVSAPTMYLHGAIDPIFAARLVDEQATRAFVPNVEIGIIEGAGHFLHLEQPDDVLPRIVEFVSA